MTGTPASFAATPGTSRREYDALAEVLRGRAAHRLGILNATFTAPFGVISPQRYDKRTPMAYLRHIGVFHL